MMKQAYIHENVDDSLKLDIWVCESEDGAVFKSVTIYTIDSTDLTRFINQHLAENVIIKNMITNKKVTAK